MEAVVWFLVGATASLVGAAAGTLVSSWVAWLAAVAAGIIATSLAKRLPVLAGSAIVGCIAGARVAGDARLAIFAALATVAALLVGAYGLARLRGACMAALASPQHPGSTTAAHVDVDASHTRLSDARVASLVRLAEADTGAFRAEAAALSGDQRQQVREALLAER